MAVWSVILLGLFGVWNANCIKPSNIKLNNNYENHTLVRLYPTNFDQLENIQKFKDPEGQVEILKPSRDVNDSLDILVPPNRMEFVHEYVDDKDLRIVVKQDNYGRVMSTVERMPKRRTMHGFDIFEYHSYQKILEFENTIAKKFPELVTLQNLGNSYEGRKMQLVKISQDPSAGNPIIFIDAGIHAREWVAPAMALYLIHRLASTPDNEDLNGVDWYILPVVNPDGYEYSRSSPANRMWRKTRSRSTSDCYGVDGNRNYGFKWAVSGVSNNPCDKQTFAGIKPFSEKETQNVRSVMLTYAKRIKVYVSIHSYGQYLVYPWGYTGDFLPKEWRKLDSLAKRVSDAVQRAGGQPFKVMSAGKWYPAAGGSDDFAFGAVGVPYSYTMELTTGYEFVFPEYLLRQVLPQFYAGFRIFGDQVKKEFHIWKRQGKESEAESETETDEE